MAEAALRTGYGHGSDVVRRLIARPIRLRHADARVPLAPAAPFESREPAPEPEATAEAPAVPAPEAAQEAVAAVAASPDLARLRTEMMLLKAVLQAERRENATLRACIGLDEAGESLGTEAQALRQRWALLVDRLLQAPA